MEFGTVIAHRAWFRAPVLLGFLVAAYLHLFAGYIPDRMVINQFAQFVVVGAIVLLWMNRRAQLTDATARTLAAEQAS